MKAALFENYPANRVSGDPKSPRQRDLIAVLRHVNTSDIPDIVITEFTEPIFFSKHRVLGTSEQSAFSGTIKHVVRPCAKKKVGWIDARWIVAIRTVMAYMKPLWDLSEVQNPTRSMGQNHPVLASVESSTSTPDQPISIRHSVSRPNPATLRVPNFRKESSRKRGGKTLLEVKPSRNLAHRQFIWRHGLLALTPLLLCLLFLSSATVFGQPAVVNRRAMVISGLAQNAGGCTPIYPTNVASGTLKVWLEADAGVFKDAGVTLAIDGDTVQQWNDQSGNGNNVTQGTAGSRPMYNTGVLNALPAIGFTNKYIGVTYGAALAQPLTYFIVYQINTGIASPGFVFDGNGATYSAGLVRVGTSIIYNMNNAGGNGTVRPTTLNTWFYDTIWYNTNSSTCMTNGIPTLLTNTIAAGTAASLRLGNNRIPDQPDTGKIAELIVYQGYVTTNDANGVNCYLKTKWGFTP